MIPLLGRFYVRYFNLRYGCLGSLWEGRFKSCLIEIDSYLLGVYRYVELNPVRALMVDQPSEYSCSSYQCNALGKESTLRAEHSLYQELGNSDQEGRKHYRSCFEVHLALPSNYLVIILFSIDFLKGISNTSRIRKL